MIRKAEAQQIEWKFYERFDLIFVDFFFFFVEKLKSIQVQNKKKNITIIGLCEGG